VVEELTPVDIATMKAWLREQTPRFALKVKPLYNLLQWKWTHCGGVPSQTDIRKTLLSMIDDAEEGTIQGGGLCVTIAIEDGGPVARLDFRVDVENYW
jgi:hypothetical protein